MRRGICEGKVAMVLPWPAQVTPEGKTDGLRLYEQFRLEECERVSRRASVNLVLNDDMRLEALAILWDQMILERCRECGVEREEFAGLEEDGDASAD